MLADIIKGNAVADGEDFYQWFVGDLRKWREDHQSGFDSGRFGLRNTQAIEVKWGIHFAGQQRPGGWTSSPGKVSLSILIRGDFAIMFRDPQDNCRPVEHRLAEEGDYLLWLEDVEHDWNARADSVVLTVRWSAK